MSPNSCVICTAKISDNLSYQFGGWGDKSTLLNANLSVIFFLKSLLPEELLAEMGAQFGTESGVSKVLEDLIVRKGCPSSWLSFCPDCTNFVEEGRKIRLKIGQLEEQFNEFRERVLTRIQDAEYEDNQLSKLFDMSSSHLVRDGVVMEKVEGDPDWQAYVKLEGDYDQDEVDDFFSNNVTPGGASNYGQDFNHEVTSALQKTASQISVPANAGEPRKKNVTKSLAKNDLGGNTTRVAVKEQVFTKSGRRVTHPDYHEFVDDYDDNDNEDKDADEEEAAPGNDKPQVIKSTELHTTGKDFKCAQCGKGFGRKRDMDTHQRIHSGVRELKCSFCDKSFRHEWSHRRHNILLHGLRPSKKYECSKCGKCFKIKWHLDQHLKSRSHGGEGLGRRIRKRKNPPAN